MVIRLRERGYCAPRCLHLREPAAQPALMRAVLRYQTNSYPPRPSLARRRERVTVSVTGNRRLRRLARREITMSVLQRHLR